MISNPLALQAVEKVLRNYEILVDRRDILQDSSTLVVRLSETLVARVVQDETETRQGIAWFERETAVAAHLSKQGAPIIPLHPDMPFIAHLWGKYPMNFWVYVEKIEEEASARKIGATLLECHKALASFRGDLPHLGILLETQKILQNRSDFSPSDQALLHRHIETSLNILSILPAQALHGDAHYGNLITTSKGLLWTDWEDVFLGPVEWDLASIIWNAKILDQDYQTAEMILESYLKAGGEINREALEQCLIARAAVVCVWYPILYPSPNASRRFKLEQRMAWLKEKRA